MEKPEDYRLFAKCLFGVFVCFVIVPFLVFVFQPASLYVLAGIVVSLILFMLASAIYCEIRDGVDSHI